MQYRVMMYLKQIHSSWLLLISLIWFHLGCIYRRWKQQRHISCYNNNCIVIFHITVIHTCLQQLKDKKVHLSHGLREGTGEGCPMVAGKCTWDPSHFNRIATEEVNCSCSFCFSLFPCYWVWMLSHEMVLPI